MSPKLRQPSKQKSLLIISRIRKQLAVTERTLDRLQKVLPGYLYFSSKGRYALTSFLSALEELEKDVISFPDEYV